ncbi:MAG: phage holin family protein [Actinomycetota bacterium]
MGSAGSHRTRRHSRLTSIGRRELAAWTARLAVIWAVGVATIIVLAWLLRGVSVDSLGSAILAIAVIGVVNALVWPMVVRVAIRAIFLTGGLLALVLNGLVVLVASEVVAGFEISGVGSGIVVILALTTTSTIVGAALSLDEDASWSRHAVRRAARRNAATERTEEPGVLFLQIDGLSHDVLLEAIDGGHAPTLARWLSEGSHALLRWECDLSSQTGAMQAGILLGDNDDMPAFRWFDKETGRIMVSNHPGDAAAIEAARSTGDGLLAAGGVSRGNVFSGDAPDSMFTFSTVGDRARRQPGRYRFFFTDPYNFARIVVLSIADIASELRAARRDRREGVMPRLDHRGGVYPFLRAATTVVLRELAVHTLLSDIYRGVPSAYADFVGYDEVAHHSGIRRPDALEVLRRTDVEIGRLERAVDHAPRPYRIVVLSDHGQTQGSTFLQRYGRGLPDVVGELVTANLGVGAPEPVGEGWGNVSGLVTDLAAREGRAAAALRRVVRNRVVDGEVVLGPGPPGESILDEDLIVLASGNLGLVYLRHLPGRVSHEQLTEIAPALIPGLAAHPGVGFVMVRSADRGAVAIGADGTHVLATGEVDGTDPLAPFGPRAARHLLRTDGFSNAPDLIVNGWFDPVTEEGAAFEELIGFHGGLGGAQTRPFVLHPAEWEAPSDEIVGAIELHHVLKGWLRSVQPAA